MLYSQQTKNFDLMLQMVDSSANNILNYCEPSEELRLDLNLIGDFKIFENRFITSFNNEVQNKGQEDLPLASTIKYVIEDTRVSYGEVFRKNLFGDYFVQREVKLKGNFIISGEEMITKDFSFNYADTIKYNSIDEVETGGLPITKGKIPPEPLFQSLVEPAVIVITAGLAVYLFFTVRSK